MRELKQTLREVRNDPKQLMIKLGRKKLDSIRQVFADRVPGMDVENVIFNDKVEPDSIPTNTTATARRLYNNRLGLAIATSVSTRTKLQLFLMSLGLAAVWLLCNMYVFNHAQSFMERSTIFLGGGVLLVAGIWLMWLVMGFSPHGYNLVLPKELLTAEDLEDAKKFARRVLIRDFENSTPADMRDKFRPLTIDSEGQPVDGQVISQDLTESYALDFAGSFLAVLAPLALSMVSMGIGFLLFSTVETPLWRNVSIAAANIIPLFLIGFSVLISFFQLVVIPGIADRRAVSAVEAREASPLAKLITESGEANFRQVERARELQTRNASADKSAFMQVGESTGLFAERRDMLAPSESGMPVGLSVHDLSTHMLVLGDTGTGKTSGVLRPLIKSWADAEAGGLVVLDGKGVLPAELAGLENFQIINPMHDAFNPIENLSPDEVADGISSMFASPNSADSYFDMAATKLIRAAANVLYLASEVSPELHFNLSWLYKVAMTESGRDAAGKALFSGAQESIDKMPSVAKRAWEYLSIEFQELPERTRGSIVGNVSVWLSAFVDNEKLSGWADATTGVQIEKALAGARIGVLLPEAEYGQAGAAIAALCKQRLYRALKLRGDRWATGNDKRVLLVVDECQSLLTRDDTAMLPIARSLGLHAVFSTQNIDGMIAALGGSSKIHEAEQMLGQFKSVIALTVGTRATKEFVSDRMGSCPRARYSAVSAVTLDAASTAQVLQTQAGGFGSSTSVGQATLYSDSVASMRKISGLGGSLAAAGGAVGLDRLFQSRNENSAQLTVGVSKLVSADEISVLTAEPDTALVTLMRGRVPRRDLVRLKPIYNFEEAQNENV